MIVWKPGKLQSHKIEDLCNFVWCWTIPHRAQILCLNFIKYYSLWLHVSSQLSLLDDYFNIWKHNELNHFPHHHTAICIQAQTANIFARLFTFETGRLPLETEMYSPLMWRVTVQSFKLFLAQLSCFDVPPCTFQYFQADDNTF
jgi:hypothetical protein